MMSRLATLYIHVYLGRIALDHFEGYFQCEITSFPEIRSQKVHLGKNKEKHKLEYGRIINIKKIGKRSIY